MRSINFVSAIRLYLYKSTLISNGESKSFSMACFVSFSERLACSGGISNPDGMRYLPNKQPSSPGASPKLL